MLNLEVLSYSLGLPVACKAPLSMGFSRQEYWNGLPFSPPGHLPHPGSNPRLLSPTLAGGFFTTSATCSIYPVLAGGFFTTSGTWEALIR